MNKSDLVDAIAQHAEIPQAAATRALEASINAISAALKRGESVTLAGFGAFVVKERPARVGRNPRSGETIQIAASRAVSFKPGKALKDGIN